MRRRFFNTNSLDAIDSSLNYLSFTSELDNSTISLTSKTSPDIKYSLNGGNWVQWDYSTITLNAGDVVYMKGNNSGGFSTSSSNYNQFKMTGKIAAGGNIMSLLYEDNFEEELSIPHIHCYYSMFYGCTSLITAPELPATTLAGYCYYYMFRGCTSLTTAPELPATRLSLGCYSSMFSGCTSLITAPELPATTLAGSCYDSMFLGCTSLITAPELPATRLKNYCYSSMFSNCTSLTTAPELPATILENYCYRNMFSRCTHLTTAPELLATTLASGCYNLMFYYCRKLNYIKMLATDISASNCLNDWVSGVASSGTFVKHPDMTTLPSGTSGIPTGWTVEDYVLGGGNNLITFTVDGVEYQAEEGMTWEEWVNSEFNIDGFYAALDGNDVVIFAKNGYYVMFSNGVVSEFVYTSDIVRPENSYDTWDGGFD